MPLWKEWWIGIKRGFSIHFHCSVCRCEATATLMALLAYSHLRNLWKDLHPFLFLQRSRPMGDCLPPYQELSLLRPQDPSNEESSEASCQRPVPNWFRWKKDEPWCQQHHAQHQDASLHLRKVFFKKKGREEWIPHFKPGLSSPRISFLASLETEMSSGNFSFSSMIFLKISSRFVPYVVHVKTKNKQIRDFSINLETELFQTTFRK